MPKSAPAKLPISALFGIAKPSGPVSMQLINQLKELVATSRLFTDAKAIEKVAKVDAAAKKKDGKGKGLSARKRAKMLNVKMGQGGTLDPLADGVLVVGINRGTKKLSDFLDCVKEYRTTCLLGCETDSYDSEGARVRVAPWRHVTRDQVEHALAQFRGDIQQTPPIFSALKMDGMPLYEYARKGIPLPRPIEKRPVKVLELELVEWLGTDHAFRWPEKTLSSDEVRALEKALSGMGSSSGTAEDAAGTAGAVEVKNEIDPQAGTSGDVATEIALGTGTDAPTMDTATSPSGDTPASAPTAFVIRMRVGGGTYVRSIVHDLGHALGSAAHVVTLTRSKQGRFVLEQLESDSDMPLLKPPSNAEEQPSAEPTEPETSHPTLRSAPPPPAPDGELTYRCIPWSVFEQAALEAEGGGERAVDSEGWTSWEREVIEHMEVVPES